MATRLFVEPGLALQARVSLPHLRIVAPAFQQTRALAEKSDFKLVSGYRWIQAATGYRDLYAPLNYVRPYMRDVRLDPDSKNLYLRDPTANFVVFEDAASLSVEKALASDNFSFTDVTTYDFGKGLLDVVAFAEDFSILFEVLREFSDSVSFGEDVRYIGYSKNASDSVTVSEDYSLETTKALADQFTFSETRFVHSIAKPFANALAVDDDFSKVVGFVRAFDEAPALTDTNTVTFDKVDSELIAVSESAAIGTNKPQSETITVSEVFSRVAEFNRTFADAFVLDDQAEVDSFTKEANLNKGNLVGLQETQAFAMSKDFADAVTLGDTSTLLVDKGETDLVFVAEEISLAKRSRTSSTLNASPLNSAQFNN